MSEPTEAELQDFAQHAIATLLIADAIVERLPFPVMDRLIQHPYRWDVVVDAAKPAVIAKLGAEYREDAWEDGKREAWLAFAQHNEYRWPARHRSAVAS